MSNQINEGAARYQAEIAGQNPPERSAALRTQSPQQLVTNHLDLWTSTVTPKSTSGRGRGSGKSSKIELTGIKKLRELILELAVRGKLVAQNPDDEPASKLLEKIEAEKAQLIKDGKLKKQKPLQPASDDEKPFELPQGWEWVRLGEVFNIVYGKGLATAELTDEGYDVFGANGLIGKYHSYTYEQPQLLISCRGAYSGKANLSPEYCLVTSNSLVLENTWKLLSLRFFYYQLSVGDKSAIVTGSAQPQVTTANLSPYAVGLPPLAEQQRIVAKVDELMVLCDQLEQQSEHQLSAHQQLTDTLLGTLLQPAAGALTESADARTKSSQKEQLNDNWQRLAQHFDLLFSGPMGAWAIDRLKDTILQLAVMGKLIPQNPDDEPASKLLERIEEEKARLVKEGKIKKPKKLPPVSDEEKPFELPEGWEWIQLNDVTKDLKYGTSKKCDYPTQNTAVLRIPNVVSGVIDLEDIKYTDMSDKELHDLTLSSGDLLFIRSNGSTDIVGRCAVIEKDLPGYAYAGYLVRCRTFSNSISSIYLKKCMDSSNTRAQIEFPIRTTSGVKNINSTELSKITFPLPPLTEQRRIVAKVDELFALCEQLKDRLQQASETEQHLTNAIVEQALS